MAFEHRCGRRFAGIVDGDPARLLVGVGRLSRNWLIRKICTVYVEIFRNIPPLLVIFFWYFGVLALLPLPRESIGLPFGSYLNIRGFYLPAFVWNGSGLMVLGGLAIGLVPELVCARRALLARWRQANHFPVFWVCLALIVGLPLLGFRWAACRPRSIFPRRATST